MLDWMRNKMGPVMVGLIIGFIAFVFVFEGVFFKGKFSGIHEGAVAGAVNGETIALPEFNRALERRMEFFKNMMGGKVTEQQLQAFRLREAVFKELVDRKLMAQAARDAGMIASDAELRQRIQEMDVFQKDGRFDLATYREVLSANRMNEGRFEQMMREDLSIQQWDRYFGERALVSEEEAKRDYLTGNDKREIRYALLTPEAVAQVVFSDADALKFAADAANQAAVQGRYDAGKETQFKGQPLERARLAIARELMAEKRGEELKGALERLSEQVVAALGDEARVKALLKPYGLEVRSSGPIGRSSRFIPGVGEAPELMNDAFAAASPIDLKAGGKPKKYTTAAGTVAAAVISATRPDLAKFASEREAVIRQLRMKKERELMDAWMKDLNAKAKIERNRAVVEGDGSES